MNLGLETLFRELVYVTIVVVAPVLTTYLVKLLERVFNKVSVETDTLVINDTINTALDIILSAVMKTSQTYVESLKESGEFTEEAQRKAFEDTKNTILLMLNDETKSLIQSLYNDLDTWLDVQIEAAVKSLK